MRLVNCPGCFGQGSHGFLGRCGVCHGKKKVNAEWSKWFKERKVYSDKAHKKSREEAYEIWVGKMKIYDKKHPVPRKFA